MTKAIQTIVIFLLLSIEQVSFGQTFNYNEDFAKILARTKDQNDSLSYDKLLKRFQVNDTTLSDYQVLALLIGFTDKKEYKPYSDLDTERKIFDLNGDGKYKEALDSATVFLKTHPLSVKALFEKSYSFHKLGAVDSARYYAYKGRRIFDAMFFSGNGTTIETPTFALGPADGQDFIYKYVGADIGMMASGSDEHGNFIDILEAEFDSGKMMTLYFVIQHATSKMFEGKNTGFKKP